MNTIYITEDDYQLLHNLIQQQQQQANTAPNIRLKEELKRAKRVPAELIPPDVVTLNSRVRVLEKKSGSVMDIEIVFPNKADFNAGKISVLSPIGTALLGSREGEEVVWSVPYCKFTYQIQEVLYQPEAAASLV